MRVRALGIGVSLVLLLALSGQKAGAGTISINTTVTSQVRDGNLLVHVILNNLGDEAAHAVQIEASAFAAKATSKGPDRLPPRKPFEADLKLPFAPKLPGTYPVLVRVYFQDANQYAFSSLAPGLATYEKSLPSSLLLRGLPGEVDEEGRVGFSLANLAERPLNLKFSFHAPREFTLLKKELLLELAGRSKKDIPVEIKNFTALSGATYPILAIAEYDDAGVHFTSSAQAMAQVRPSDDPLKRWRYPLIALAALLVIAGIVWELRRRRARKS